MVFVLLVLSLAMIVGGLFAVVLGWDIVLLERGWAMVIAGSVTAGSGAVLLGLAAAVARLGAVRSQVASLREEINRLAAPVPPAPALDGVAAASAVLVAGRPAETETAEAGDREREGAPGLPDFLRPQAAQGAGRDETSPRPGRSYDPDGLLADEDEAPHVANGSRPADRTSDPQSGAGLAQDDSALPPFEPEDQAVPARTPPPEAGAASGAGPLPGPEPAEEPKSEPDSEPETSPTVVGTYNSGDNRYVMFSDGSIQAETPDGVFRFESLDELKEFIASGGESSSGSR